MYITVKHEAYEGWPYIFLLFFFLSRYMSSYAIPFLVCILFSICTVFLWVTKNIQKEMYQIYVSVTTCNIFFSCTFMITVFSSYNAKITSFTSEYEVFRKLLKILPGFVYDRLSGTCLLCNLRTTCIKKSGTEQLVIF